MKVLAAQFIWQSPAALPAVAVATAVMLALLLWLYPPQIRTIKRRWRWAMPALRVLAMTALALSLLRPSALLPRTVKEQGALVVLVDQSKSMSVADPGRTPAERVAVADALGLLPAGSRQEPSGSSRATLEGLARRVSDARRARSALDYAALAGRGTEAARSRVAEIIAGLKQAASPLARDAALRPVDQQVSKLSAMPDDAALASLEAALEKAFDAIALERAKLDQALYAANPAVKQVCDTLPSRSRFDLATMAITRSGGVLASLPGQTPVFCFTFSDQLTPAPLALGKMESGPAWPGTAGVHSDIAGAVGRAMDRMRGRPVQAVLLLSDGRQNGGQSLATLGVPAGVPLLAVDVAGPVRRDVAIAGISVPQRCFANETLSVRVDLRAVGASEATVRVSCDGEDAAGVQSRAVALGTGRALAEFSLKPLSAGLHRIAIEVLPVDGEASAANNSAERWVKVVNEKIAVTAISPSPGWDFHYLAGALSRAPWIALREMPSRSAATTGPATGPAGGPSALLRQDVIVLSDVSPGDISRAQWDAILEMATQRGGSVVILVNDIGVLREYESDPRLSTLLPYRSGLQASWRTWPGRQAAFRPFPASGADDAPIALLTDAGPDGTAHNLDAWQRLPALFQYLVMPELKPSTRTLLIERESGDPMVTETRVGAGRSFFVGINETWRWRRQIGERVQDRFWLQLIRGASDAPYAAHAGGLWLDADRLVMSPGDPLHVRARAEAPDGSPQAAGQLRLRLMRNEQGVMDIALHEVSSSAAGRYEAEVRELLAEPGDYLLRLEDAGNAARALNLPIRVAPPSDEAEMSDVSGDPAFLKRLAEASGGEMIPLDRLGVLPRRLADVRARQGRLSEYTLWDSPYLFAFVLACLGAEWALRKRFGLA